MKEHTQEDLRTKRTRSFLVKSLMQLLEKDSIEDISIQEICDKAMVHRTTFYTHFKDKYDLFSFALNQYKNEIYEKFMERVLPNFSPKELCLCLAEVVLTFIEEHKKQFLAISRHNFSEMINSLLFDTILDAVTNFLNHCQYKNFSKLPIEITANFYTGGLLSLVTYWLQNADKYNKTQLINFCSILLDEHLHLPQK